MRTRGYPDEMRHSDAAHPCADRLATVGDDRRAVRDRHALLVKLEADRVAEVPLRDGVQMQCSSMMRATRTVRSHVAETLARGARGVRGAA